MSKARQLADLGNVYDDGALSNRNLVINGAMQVAQRGTSETSVTSSKYANACDRFRVNGNNGTWTISQDTDAPDGFSNSFKMLLTATETIGTTSYWTAEQKIEGQNLQSLAYGTSSAKTVTVSFYVKSNITGTYCLNLYQDDGTKNFPKTYTIDSADTWEYKTISFVGDTSTALDNDNASSLRTQFFVVAGSDYTSGSAGSRVAYTNATFAAGQSAQIDAVNDYWQITGVQLEIGDTATPFEHRSYGDEFLRCLRYYEQWNCTGGENIWLGTTYSGSGSCFPQFHVIKRAAPTITLPAAGQSSGQISFLNGTGGYPTTTGTHSVDKVTTRGYRLSGSGYSGLTSSQPTTLYASGGAEIFKYDAEL